MVEKLVPSFEPLGRDGWSADSFRATTTNADACMLQLCSEACKCRRKMHAMQELCQTGDNVVNTVHHTHESYDASTNAFMAPAERAVA